MGPDVSIQDKVDKLSIDNASSLIRIATLESWIKGLQNDITEIKDVLINRPTWQITGILSFLSSTVVALVVLLFTLHSGK